MRVLLLNQTFYPDCVSSAQHLTDLALALSEQGHDVTVIASRNGYDDPSARFAAMERWRGISIARVGSLKLGKTSRWRRAGEFGSFIASCAWRLLFTPRVDVVVAMTSPPLISYIGGWFSRLKACRFVFWVMDLNPDEAVAAGWLRSSSLAARLLQRMLTTSLVHADSVVVLDRYMRERIERKGIPPDKIAVIPPWSHDDVVGFRAEGRSAFRREHALHDKFVVMYAGNHSPCNPLETLFEAAERLASHDDIVFCFVGGGSEFQRLQQRARARPLRTATFLPYQPLATLAAVLSSADLHVVTLGDPFVGLIHPCKIYNVLRVGSPILYIGPARSHVGDILEGESPRPMVWSARHGEPDRVAALILEAARRAKSDGVDRSTVGGRRFVQSALLPRLITQLTSEPAAPAVAGVGAK